MDASEASRRQRLAELMAADDPTAEIALYLEFGADVGSVVRASVRAQGGTDRLDADDLDDLTYDVCAELFRIRHSWRPDGGALPWKWARIRIDAMVRNRVGPLRRPLRPDDRDETSGPEVTHADDHQPATATLRRLGEFDGRVGVAHALISHLPARAAEMLLRYQIQIDAGDPSPSHTVGAEFGVRPAAVRQSVARARKKLRATVEVDPRFAALMASPLLGREVAA